MPMSTLFTYNWELNLALWKLANRNQCDVFDLIQFIVIHFLYLLNDYIVFVKFFDELLKTLLLNELIHR